MTETCILSFMVYGLWFMVYYAVQKRQDNVKYSQKKSASLGFNSDLQRNISQCTYVVTNLIPMSMSMSTNVQKQVQQIPQSRDIGVCTSDREVTLEDLVDLDLMSAFVLLRQVYELYVTFNVGWDELAKSSMQTAVFGFDAAEDAFRLVARFGKVVARDIDTWYDPMTSKVNLSDMSETTRNDLHELIRDYTCGAVFEGDRAETDILFEIGPPAVKMVLADERGVLVVRQRYSRVCVEGKRNPNQRMMRREEITATRTK